MTVVGVGENLRDQYHVGDRFTIQADIFVDRRRLCLRLRNPGRAVAVQRHRPAHPQRRRRQLPDPRAAGHRLRRERADRAVGLRHRRLRADLSHRPQAGRHDLDHRTGQTAQAYTISAGFDRDYHPGRLLLSDVPADFAAWLKQQAAALGVEVIDDVDVAAPPVEQVDDIVLLGPDPDLIEAVSPRLADFGIVALLGDEPLARKVNVDIGPRALQPLGLRGRRAARRGARLRRRPGALGAQAGRAGAGSSAPAGRWGGCTCSGPSRWPARRPSWSAPTSATCG